MNSTTQPPAAVFPDRFTLRCVGVRGRQLAHSVRAGFEDQQDYEQELLFHLVQSLPKFDARRASLHTFTVRVLDNHVKSLAKYRFCQKRDVRRACVSIYEAPAGGYHPEQQKQPGHDPPGDLWNLRIDVRRAIDSLPADLKRVCEVLMWHDPSSAALRLGISRAQIYRRLAAIRTVFAKAGLAHYVGSRESIGGGCVGAELEVAA